MEYVSNITYSNDEQAWLSPEITLQRSIHLMGVLESGGKILIRQYSEDKKWYRVPIKSHKDTKEFSLRIKVGAEDSKIQIFTSVKPKEIKYAYI